MRESATLLVADDDPGLRESLQRTLTRAGYRVVAVSDGRAALEQLQGGEVDLVLEVPVAKVTSCAFGGPDLGDLYITTARYGMSDEGRKQEPEAGNLFVCRPGVKGFVTPEFG